MSMIGCFLQLSQQELEQLIADPDQVQDFVFPEDEEHPDSIDVDKAWQGIHFLLTGDAWQGDPPLANVVLGGTEFGEDLGYGPARYLTDDQVQAAANALTELPGPAFCQRYDAEQLANNEVYPMIWSEPEAVTYLGASYERVRAYFLDAASKGKAMLKYLG